jgi:hypothetical protein
MAKNKFKQFSKWLTRQIAWLVLLTLVANIASTLVAPKVAQAVDASDHMLLFWPSTNCADTPSGWTAVSDGAGEAFQGMFVRGETSYSARAKVDGSHTHAVSSVTTTAIASSTGDRASGSAITGAGPSHTHTGNSATVGAAVTALPAYGEMCVIQYNNGIPNGDSAIPNGAVAIFDAAVPAGWNDYSSTFAPSGTRFIRGGTNGTGGANDHSTASHSLTNITLGAVSGSITGASQSKSYSTTSHTHAASSASSNDTPDIQPPYMNIYLGQKSNTGPIPNGMIAMFDDTDASVGFTEAGWTRLSDSGGPFYQRFLKVTGSYGSPGGSTAHSHTFTTTSNSGGDDGSTAKAGVGGPIMAHDHTVQIVLSSTANSNIPPYTDVVIAKKQTVITALTTTGPYNNNGDTVQIDLTANNYHAATNLANNYLDYVIFEDTVTADGQPTNGETYMYKTVSDCDTSGQYGIDGPGYTFRNTAFTVNAGGNTNDQQTCPNDDFPDQTTYTAWVRWWDGVTALNIYYEKTVTFYSVPTLTELLFMILVGCGVFLGVRSGVIKIKLQKPDDSSGDSPPKPSNLSNINQISNHHGESQRSNDGARDKLTND